MRLTLLGVFTFYFTSAFSQHLKPVLDQMDHGDYKKAKLIIDSMVSDHRYAGDAIVWFYKGRIYSEVSRRHEEMHPSLLQQSLSAYKRYQELDPRNKMMEPGRNVELFQLYDFCYKTGTDQYEKEKYERAYWYLLAALETEEYIHKKGFSFNGEKYPAIDTQLVSLVAFSAYLGNHQEESIPYFERLAELKMAGEEYKGVYTLLTQYYIKKNDAIKAAKYLNAGRQLFPDHAHWIKLEFGQPANERERFARYEQLITKYPADFELHLDYAIEIFNYCYGRNVPGDLPARKKNLEQVISKALKLQPGSALANAVMSEHIYNDIYDSEKALKGMNGETADQKAAVKKLTDALEQRYEELYLYSKKAFEEYSSEYALDASSKEHLRKVLTQLVTYHQKKKQAAQSEMYREKLKAVN